MLDELSKWSKALIEISNAPQNHMKTIQLSDWVSICNLAIYCNITIRMDVHGRNIYKFISMSVSYTCVYIYVCVWNELLLIINAHLVCLIIFFFFFIFNDHAKRSIWHRCVQSISFAPIQLDGNINYKNSIEINKKVPDYKYLHAYLWHTCTCMYKHHHIL